MSTKTPPVVAAGQATPTAIATTAVDDAVGNRIAPIEGNGPETRGTIPIED